MANHLKSALDNRRGVGIYTGHGGAIEEGFRVGGGERDRGRYKEKERDWDRERDREKESGRG